jgi:hypothetical protein
VSLLVTIVGSPDRELLAALRDSGFRTAEASFADVPLIHPAGAKGPDAFVFDVRGNSGLPKDVATIRRNFPGAGAVVVASSLDPVGMLDAMRQMPGSRGIVDRASELRQVLRQTPGR